MLVSQIRRNDGIWLSCTIRTENENKKYFDLQKKSIGRGTCGNIDKKPHRQQTTQR